MQVCGYDAGFAAQPLWPSHGTRLVVARLKHPNVVRLHYVGRPSATSAAPTSGRPTVDHPAAPRPGLDDVARGGLGPSHSRSLSEMPRGRHRPRETDDATIYRGGDALLIAPQKLNECDDHNRNDTQDENRQRGSQTVIIHNISTEVQTRAERLTGGHHNSVAMVTQSSSRRWAFA